MATKKQESLDFESIFDDPAIKGHPFKTFFRLYQGQVGNLLLSFLFFIIKHSPVWVIPVVTANMINIASDPSNRSMTEMWINLAVILAVIAQNIVSSVLHISFLSKASRHVEASLRSTMIRKLQHLSISYHRGLSAGQLQAKVLRDVENIEILTKQMMFTISAAVTNVIVAITVTAYKNGTVALFFVLVVPLAMIIVTIFKDRLKRRNKDFRTEIETMSGQVAETVTMIPVTRAHGLEDLEIDKTDRTLHNLKSKGYLLDMAEAFFGSTGWVVFQSFQMFTLIFTSILAYKGEITLGDIALYQAYFSSILMSVNEIISAYPQLAKGYESITSVSEVLFSDDSVEYKGKQKLTDIKGKFDFEHVKFQYEETERHVLQDFNLSVEPGESIAFVGDSGAGKSTVLNLIIGFFRPTGGKVLIDDIPFDDIDMQAYRNNIAVVSQETILFSGSIRDNITYGLEDVTDEQINRAVNMANLQDVIADMPQGLSTKIGEHGGKLSGGQRQRIAIARALIREPHVIVLDEATSALDNKSEFKVQQAIQELIKGRTTFIVAHRLSTIRDADRIVVMRDGQVVETGTYEELIEKQGEFYELKQLQL